MVGACVASGFLLLGSCGGGGGASVVLVSVDPAGFEGNEYSSAVAISEDGRYVAFRSAASNLVENDANDVLDIFVRDIQGGITCRVSVSDTAVEADGESLVPAISSDGRYITFSSDATNLLDGTTTSGLAHIYRVRWR